jgi:hypothetical protein
MGWAMALLCRRCGINSCPVDTRTAAGLIPRPEMIRVDAFFIMEAV